MASIYAKKGWLYARLKGIKVPGKWGAKKTIYRVGEEALAKRYAKDAQKMIDKRLRIAPAADVGPLTFRRYVTTWLEMRRDSGHDWKQDRGRLQKHVVPVLGDLELADIRAHHIAALIRMLRFDPKKKRAQRTVRNIYTVLSSLFRDAEIGDESGPKIERSPCILTDAQLGPLTDKDPEWRTGALFTRDEAQTLISHAEIPLDRQLVYAFGLLAGLRPGEAAALRWRHYDPTTEPLGRLLVATAYNTKRVLVKGTKTEAPKSIPVHATLAAMLDEWREGWARMMGRQPGPDDLIVPLPPETVARRTKRLGEPFRGYDYTGRRWRDLDLPMLGWRSRSVYDTKSTFITLAIDDGADPSVIRDRITHTKPKRSAFDGYDRGPHWASTCAELGKLRIERRCELATSFATDREIGSDVAALVGSGGGLRRRGLADDGSREVEVVVGVRPRTSAERDPSSIAQVTWLATALASAVLGGDWVIARRLAREVKSLNLRMVA